MAKIIVKNLHKEFRENDSHLTILNNISFIAENGQFICMVGPSGCGKSTILNSIAGLINYSGEIKIEYEMQSSSKMYLDFLKNNRLDIIKTLKKLGGLE